MSIFKLLPALTIGLSLLVQPAVAKSPPQKGDAERNAVSVDADSGVIGSVDAIKGRIMISDRTYVFSPLTLIVHEAGRASGVTSLRPNQKVRFLATQRKPGMPLTSTWAISEIWIDEK